MLSQPARSPLAKLLAFVLSAILLVLGLMFSLVALAVVAIGGLALWGWLRWKTRALRQQMRTNERTFTRRNDGAGNIIEGEAVRTDKPLSQLQRLG